jgi:hypothetical protein
MTVTNLTAICAALALLTPLVKAFSQWHLGLRKLQKPTRGAAAPAIPPSDPVIPWYKRPGSSGWFALFGLLLTSTMAFLGIYLLGELCRSEVPVTTGSVALIAVGSLAVVIGFLKEWKV